MNLICVSRCNESFRPLSDEGERICQTGNVTEWTKKSS